MPHVYIKEFNENKYQQNNYSQNNLVKFGQLFQSRKSQNRFLLHVEALDKKFFLEILKRGEQTLIKSEKGTRPSPNYPVHVAIHEFTKLLNLEVLSSNLNTKPSPHLNDWAYLIEIDDVEKFANSKNYIQIEIGFGSGIHLLDLAEKNPNIDFIGIEIYKPAVEQVLKQIKIKKLNNLRVIDFDARQLLETLPSNKIDAIYLHFPVPWDDQPHRRVLSKRFLDEVKRVLKVGGFFELRTDSEELFKFSMELFLNENQIKFELQKNIKIDVASKYESRWLKMNKNIYNVKIESLQKSDEKKSFDIQQIRVVESCKERIFNGSELIGKRVLKDNWFINFIDILDSYNNDKIVQIICGSYFSPTERFLLLNENKIEYLIKSPLEIEENNEIDKYLRELFESCQKIK